LGCSPPMKKKKDSIMVGISVFGYLGV